MTTILITGAGRGIGFELAKQALFMGWNVIGSVRSSAAAHELRANLPKITPVEFDVTDHAAIDAVAKTMEPYTLDVVVNNAGIITPQRQSARDMDFEGFTKTLEVNVLAPLKIAQAFYAHLSKANNPRLVTLSSAMGSMASMQSDRLAYRASKAAVNKVIQGMAADFVADGICCISMHPGWVQTDMGGPNAAITPEESAAGILEVIRNLTIQDTGRFINWDGSLMDW